MGFFDLPPKTMTLVACILGFIMIDDLSGPEQNVLGNFLQLIGQTLELNSAQMQLLESKESDQRMALLEARLDAYDRMFHMKN